ncbi:lipase [Corynebacterium sp. TAE3-ERU12]|uniref:esterase/lipase family protein n=1 Tax=Corynebacterium sp. TAE3-ERU12 TaxID=2849491 RepID=UPI001C48B761|nr:lipase [Corynebacterium sp. TAE3-ERU12]MBV7294632.1 lipase [Corynebacterium sp. TAE3-ERU12]
MSRTCALSVAFGAITAAAVGRWVWISRVNNGPQGREHGPHEPLPVVYVAGSWQPEWLAQRAANSLRRRGFDVYPCTLHDPERPRTLVTRTVRDISEKLPAFVDEVLTKTGASQVDVVAYSLGGLVVRYWLKEFGGAEVVRTAVLLSGVVQGSPVEQWLEERGWLPTGDSVSEVARGGDEIKGLNTPQEAVEGVRYVCITTRYEIDAAPYEINFLSGPGEYDNILIQDQLPGEPILHQGLDQLSGVWAGVADALRGRPVNFQSVLPWRRKWCG